MDHHKSPGSFVCSFVVVCLACACVGDLFLFDQAGLPPLSVGDVLGVAIDQADYPVQCYFYKGSTLVHQMSGIRGEVLPAFSVADGAQIEVNFGHTAYAYMPNGFQGIIRVVSML